MRVRFGADFIGGDDEFGAVLIYTSYGLPDRPHCATRLGCVLPHIQFPLLGRFDSRLRGLRYRERYSHRYPHRIQSFLGCDNYRLTLSNIAGRFLSGSAFCPFFSERRLPFRLLPHQLLFLQCFQLLRFLRVLLQLHRLRPQRLL